MVLVTAMPKDRTRIKTFIFDEGQTSDEIDDVVNKWLRTRKSDDLTINSSITTTQDAPPSRIVLITILLVHDETGSSSIGGIPGNRSTKGFLF